MTIDPLRTFDTLYVTRSNRGALRAIMTALRTRPHALFVKGPSGSGKTHLLHALANEHVALRPSETVQLISGEQFCRRYIDDIRAGRMHTFRKTMQSPSVLLVDGIEELSRYPTAIHEVYASVATVLARGGLACITMSATDRAFERHVRRGFEALSHHKRLLWRSPAVPTRIAAVQDHARHRGYRLVSSLLGEIARTTRTIPEARAAFDNTMLRLQAV